MLVTLKGTGFADGATVTFGGVPATSVVVATSHFITCQTPTHAAGAVNVVVTNPDASASNTVSYTYLANPVWWAPDWPTVKIPPTKLDPKEIKPPPKKKVPPPLVVCELILGDGAPTGGTEGEVYIPFVFSASLGTPPYSFSLLTGDLPPGLSLKGASITGTPSERGVFTFVVECDDKDGCSAYAGYTIIIWPPAEPFEPTLYPWTKLNPIYPPLKPIDRKIPVVPGGPVFPKGTTFTWKVTTPPPSDKGWWNSVNEAFSGAGATLSNVIPRNPRGFPEIASFSPLLGGSPGISGVWRNNLLYATGGYTVGTTLPTIRMFDGTFDREVISIPLASGGVVPKAVLSLLVANDTLYLSTLDSGTSSADYSGRVFTLDPDRGTITPLGNPFPAGHVPYALAWHLGRLWVGTNRGNGSAGKVYFFRPDIDLAWTEDHDLGADGGATSLLSFQGLLYVGTSSKVLVRDGLGAYTTSDASGGGLALTEFQDHLLSSSWASPLSKIRRLSGGSWSTVYTEPSGVPILAFPTSSSTILALGGGTGFSAAVATSPDGVTWTNRTVFLDQGTPASTGVPAFGSLVL